MLFSQNYFNDFDQMFIQIMEINLKLNTKQQIRKPHVPKVNGLRVMENTNFQLSHGVVVGRSVTHYSICTTKCLGFKTVVA